MDRYERQILIPGWGRAGQKRVAAATVFVAGAGGLGSPVALYLAAAGVGTLRLCDGGIVKASNLNRQLLYGNAALGTDKALSAVQRLRGLNPEIELIPLQTRIEENTVEDLVGDADIIIDCLDSFATRYVVNDYAVARNLPLVHAGVAEFAGQITFLHPPKTPCLRCVFPNVPDPSAIPIAGPTAGLIGSLAALEALKYLTGIGRLLRNRLLLWDGTEQCVDTVEIGKDSRCPVCAGL